MHLNSNFMNLIKEVLKLEVTSTSYLEQFQYGSISKLEVGAVLVPLNVQF